MLKSFLYKNRADQGLVSHAVKDPKTRAAAGACRLESREAIPSLAPSSELEPSSSVKKPVIGVIGAKGGVGATTTAINLSLAISRQCRSTILIDANLQQPDAAVVLGRQPRYSLLDLLQRKDEIDLSVLDACLLPVSGAAGNCGLLSPPISGVAGVRSELSAVAACLENMRHHADFWLIDLPKTLDRHLVTLMDSCDRLLLVFEPTLLSTSSASRWLSVFAELGYLPEKITCVVNRSGGRHKSVQEQIAAFPPFHDIVAIPNAYDLSEKCLIHGEPAVARHPRDAYSVAIGKLASSLREKL